MNNQFIPSREETNKFYSRKLSPLAKYSSESSPFTRVQSVTAVRKKPWNRRFIYNKIPDYYQINDKNVKLNKKPRMCNMHKNSVFDTNYITYQQSKKKKNFKKGFNRTTSGFFSHSSYITNNNEFSFNNRNIISPLTNSALNRNNLMREKLNLNVNSNDENFSSIKKLWNELCVQMSYREVFIIIYNQLSGEEKEQFYQKELSELNSVKNDIKSLNYYIEQRTNILKDLYEQNIKLNRLKNTDDAINEILNDISTLIEKLRDATIDVCYAMRKLKNDMYMVNNITKYDIDLLSSKSKFDKNYLIKMKGELSFLKEGNAKFFFNLNGDRSPFLLKASDPIANNEKDLFMRIIPIKDEIKEHIKECNYYIYQELIAYQQNIIAKEKIFRCVSPIKVNARPMMINNSFNNEGDISKNNYVGGGGGVFNESAGFRKINKNNIFGDRPSDINSMISTNDFIKKKIQNSVGLNINRQMPKPNKDLFSQKLLWGFMPGDWGQEIAGEDEKVKDEKEEDKTNEEEEEEEDKSDDDTTRNELNELIEEKKSELDGNESSKSKINNKKITEENKNKTIDNEKENHEQKINTNIINKNKNNRGSKMENINNRNIDENKSSLNNKNEDINKYLNSNNNIEQNTINSKSKNNNQIENEKILINNPINSYSSEKKEVKKDASKSELSKINTVNNNKKEEIKTENKENNIDENKDKEKNT